MALIPRPVVPAKSLRCTKRQKEVLVLAMTVVMILAGCQGEKLINPSVTKAPRDSKVLQTRPGFSGFLSANVSLKRSMAGRNIEVQEFRFAHLRRITKIVIPADVVIELGRSMTEVPIIGQPRPNLLLLSQQPRVDVAFASASSDPEAILDSFAQVNPVPSQGEDIYLAQPEWDMLMGASYTEDIGDGTIAMVVVDPISSTNPNGVVRLYLNGRRIVTVNPQYGPVSGGWQEQTSVEATYSYYSGAQTSSGTRRITGPQEPTKWQPKSRDELNFYREHPRFANFLDNLLPATAYAQENCNTHMRAALLGVIGMYFNGRRGNVGGFILSWAGVVNGVHGFARCRERAR